jgi:hypothetical protein
MIIKLHLLTTFFVLWESASRLGIIKTDDNTQGVPFKEKPLPPRVIRQKGIISEAQES